MENIKIKKLKNVLESFNKFAKDVIYQKEQDLTQARDPEGRILLHSFDIESFYNKEVDPLKQTFIPHLALEELAVLLKDEYASLEITDIYFALPHIFYNMYNFLLWEKDAINVDYNTSGSRWEGFRSYVNFIPVNTKPKSFNALYLDESLDFALEVIEKTLQDINTKCQNVHLDYELVFGFRFMNRDQTIKIDDRMTVTVKDEQLTITAKYTGSPYMARVDLQKDLFGILSLLEMNGGLKYNNSNPYNDDYLTLEKKIPNEKSIKFKYTKPHSGGNASFDFILHNFKQQLDFFYENDIMGMPLYFFLILSNEFDGDVLQIIPNFFSSENYRFPRTQFFNYWSALEILLGNPESDIGNSLNNSYEYFFPKEKNISDKKGDPQKTISKLWAIRNDVVHNGKISVDFKVIWKIQNIVKSLFNKILLTRMTDTHKFSIELYQENLLKKDDDV